MTTTGLFLFLGSVITVAVLGAIIAVVTSVSGAVGAIVDDEDTLRCYEL